MVSHLQMIFVLMPLNTTTEQLLAVKLLGDARFNSNYNEIISPPINSDMGIFCQKSSIKQTQVKKHF